MDSLASFARLKLAELDRRGTHRRLVETWREDGIVAWRDGKRLISFCCNDYLNLTHHPAVKRAAAEAIERYGAGSGASRLVTGNHPLYRGLEERLARLNDLLKTGDVRANAFVMPGDVIIIPQSYF